MKKIFDFSIYTFAFIVLSMIFGFILLGYQEFKKIQEVEKQIEREYSRANY